ncbi:MAG: hypothetical protein WBF43_12850 [Methylocella sp.]
MTRPPLGGNDRLRALEFLLVALERRKFETGTATRYRLPGMA